LTLSDIISNREADEPGGELAAIVDPFERL
jgi:hypothetical protein